MDVCVYVSVWGGSGVHQSICTDLISIPPFMLCIKIIGKFIYVCKTFFSVDKKMLVMFLGKTETFSPGK